MKVALQILAFAALSLQAESAEEPKNLQVFDWFQKDSLRPGFLYEKSGWGYLSTSPISLAAELLVFLSNLFFPAQI